MEGWKDWVHRQPQTCRLGRTRSTHVKQMLRGLILFCAYGCASEKISHFSEKENGHERIP